MLDDRTLALLGDKAAQERITERGELLECPCGGKAERKGPPANFAYRVACVRCRMNTGGCKTQEEADKKWNHRASILTETQIALLKMAEKPRKFREGEK